MALDPATIQRALAHLTPPERAEVDRLLGPPPVWTPLPGPQTDAYYSLADELFYGGSAAGGKSDLLLGLAGTQHHRSVIFRRVFPECRSLIERSREIFNAPGVSHAQDSFNESLHLWRLASGRQIEIAALQYEKDAESQRGRPRDLYAWDELPEFTEKQFRTVNAWLRSVRPNQRCRVVGGGNPPTTEQGEWVIHYWAPWLDPQYPNPATPGELRWFVRVDDRDQEVEGSTPIVYNGETIKPRSRTFIPARLKDNPYLARTDYGAVLQGLPEPLRSQLLYGDFTLGTMLDPWQVCPRAWVQAAQARWVETPANKHPLACVGVDPARGGGDRFGIALRYGSWFAPVLLYPGSETPDGPTGAHKVLDALGEHTAPIQVDVIGIGSAVYDALKDRTPTIPINVSTASTATDKTGRLRFVNLRAEMWWRFREALDPDHGEGVALPPGAPLLADLCSARYHVQSNGIQVEPKADLKERLGRSPDEGEAVLLAYYQPRPTGWAAQIDAALAQARARGVQA